MINPDASTHRCQESVALQNKGVFQKRFRTEETESGVAAPGCNQELREFWVIRYQVKSIFIWWAMKLRTHVQTLGKIKAWKWRLGCFFSPHRPWETHRVFLLSCRCSWFGRWHRRMLINSTPWRFWRRRRSKVHQPEATDYLHRNKTGWQDWRCNAGVNINVNCIFFSRKAILCLLSA